MTHGVNKVILVGRAGRDPEVKTSQSGKRIAVFSLATSEKWGEEERTEWHRIKTFDKMAEVVAKYVRKGDLLYLEGRISSNSWEDDKGKHTIHEIITNNIQFLASAANRREARLAETARPDREPDERTDDGTHPPATYKISPSGGAFETQPGDGTGKTRDEVPDDEDSYAGDEDFPTPF
ncbi:MAG: single-stranded DNA-binding protein [Deltaproteobacteria bacterium]|nr:single-stranded DNA-binding protein [Deltaproteobacteria bacterium]